MNPSKYLSKIQAANNNFLLTGNGLLVERIPEQQNVRKSGLIVGLDVKGQVNTLAAQAPTMVYVLAVGPGYYDETTDSSIPLDTKPGDILLVGNHSVKWLPFFPIDGYTNMEIGISSESETQMRWRGLKEYERFVESLNREAEDEMEASPK